MYTALIHNFTCRLEARQALIYQLVFGLTGKNGKYNFSKAVHVYPPFSDITCSAKNYKIAPALTKVKVEMVVSKVPVQEVIDSARKALYTGRVCDGKFFVYDVEQVVKVRTGELGYDALQGEE